MVTVDCLEAALRFRRELPVKLVPPHVRAAGLLVMCRRRNFSAIQSLSVKESSTIYSASG